MAHPINIGNINTAAFFSRAARKNTPAFAYFGRNALPHKYSGVSLACVPNAFDTALAAVGVSVHTATHAVIKLAATKGKKAERGVNPDKWVEAARKHPDMDAKFTTLLAYRDGSITLNDMVHRMRVSGIRSVAFATATPNHAWAAILDDNDNLLISDNGYGHRSIQSWRGGNIVSAVGVQATEPAPAPAPAPAPVAPQRKQTSKWAPLTPAQIDAIIRLRKEGRTYYAIQDVVGLEDWRRAYFVCRDAGLTKKRK